MADIESTKSVAPPVTPMMERFKVKLNKHLDMQDTNKLFCRESQLRHLLLLHLNSKPQFILPNRPLVPN